MLLSGSLRRSASFAVVAITAALAAAVTDTHAQAPIVQPGAPGQASRLISAEESVERARVPYSEADVQFVRNMIAHHAQALEMTALLPTRTATDDMRRLAERIEISQRDEIATMQQWLIARGEALSDAHAQHAAGAEPMAGMLSADDMARLTAARGVEFDRLFLQLMIKHHRGAVTMVERLMSQVDAAQDAQLFAFTADVTADQSAEILRMDGMLAALSTDPRVGLAAGFLDAGSAAWNLELVATRPRPDGFYDPNAPAGMPLPGAPARPGSASAPQAATNEGEPSSGEPDGEEKPEENGNDQPAAEAEAKPAEPGPSPRRLAGLLDFANSDLAFAGDHLFAGNFHGFNVYDISNPGSPELVASVVCPGGQGDLSVAGNLLIMSVEQTRGRVDCGRQGVADPFSPERFRGVRIFDISDVRLPKQVGAVQTCRGSHTHTLVPHPDRDDILYVYGSGVSVVRSDKELSGCSGKAAAEDPQTSLFRIDVIEIPLARPWDARIVNQPAVFTDAASGTINGLWKGGDHGPGTQTTWVTDACHDITAYPEIGLAAGACSGNGILLDISDPINPIRLDSVVDPGFAYWHSATFNNDGTKVVFTDEWGGGGGARCRASDPREWGANAIFDIVDRKLVLRSYYKLPAPQTEQENCVAHNGSLVPVPGRDLLVQAWYQGGISVMDFTNSSAPVEIAYFDRGPIDAERLIVGGHWSAYWYRGLVFATEISRGLDVLRLLPSAHLTAAELAAAAGATGEFNPQQQRRVEWTAEPVVARAYLDQLRRDGALAATRLDGLGRLLDRIESRPTATASALADEIEREASALERDGRSATGPASRRLSLLVKVLQSMATQLRRS